MEEMTQTYHSNPPSGPQNPFKETKTLDPLDLIVNSKEDSVFDKS
jgi:hypothetical protein